MELRVEDVGPEAAETAADVGRALSDHASDVRRVHKLVPKLGEVSTDMAREVQRRSGEAEQKMARALGVDRWLIDRASTALWGTTLAAERNRRAGPNANAQRRGRIT
ncbi:hypothetical protein EB74_26865 [Mycobacterium sp. SWH-M5]|nr:hypothetical protein EB74_26865 [Mycobacterium sp. SWH-M5]